MTLRAEIEFSLPPFSPQRAEIQILLEAMALAEKSLCFVLLELAENLSSGTSQKMAVYGARERYSQGGVSGEVLRCKITKGGNARGSSRPLSIAGCHTLQEPGAGVTACAVGGC